MVDICQGTFCEFCIGQLISETVSDCYNSFKSDCQLPENFFLFPSIKAL